LALESEVRLHQWQWLPETIYWGGGTPSLMPLERFEAVMSLIPGKRWIEATLECAPGTVDEDKVMAWAHAGINRVSLGVQSFVTSEARQTGRKHTAETVASDVTLLRRCGISNINIDLIAGLPGQNESSWRYSLEWLERLNPPHASIYLFEMDEDSTLGKEALLGGLRYGAALLPGDGASAAFYEYAVAQLASMGLERYEISNFAISGAESRHNLKYWQLHAYVGFGLDAHSFDGRSRCANTDDLEAYLNWLESEQSPRTESARSDVEEERFFVGLRQSAGIEPTEQEWTRFRKAIEYGIQCGVLERDRSILRLTPRGFLVSNEIFQEFLSSPHP
jgi:oxygen-independent coproporphyrinogen-3 oxidase